MRAISKHAQFEDLFLGAYYLPAHLERRIHRKVGEGVEPSGIRVSSGIISNPSSTGSVISEGGSTGQREDSEVWVFSSGISYRCTTGSVISVGGRQDFVGREQAWKLILSNSISSGDKLR